jgi:Flp pilus assembly protein TadD
MSDEYAEPWPAEDEATEVVRAYERASQLSSDDAQVHFDYGLAFMELGPGLERHAVEAFEAAVRLRPAWAQAHTQLGYAYASAGRRDEAIAEYRQALMLSPGDVDTWGALAHVAFLSDRYEEAEQAGVRLVDAQPLTAGPHLILGLAQLLLGRHAEAEESFRRAIQLEPDMAEGHYGLGLAAVALGNVSTVAVQHQVLSGLKPEFAEYLARHSRRRLIVPAEVVRELFGITDE